MLVCVYMCLCAYIHACGLICVCVYICMWCVHAHVFVCEFIMCMCKGVYVCV